MVPGIKGIWSLKSASAAEYDTYLVLTFVGETRILAINAADELDEAEIDGFQSETQARPVCRLFRPALRSTLPVVLLPVI